MDILSLYLAAVRVLERTEDVSNADIETTCNAGLVKWSVDCDERGYFPQPTGKYIDLAEDLECEHGFAISCPEQCN